MNNENLYEKRRLRDRFRDIVTLALFTLAVAVISAVIMNLLIYPVTVFAVRNRPAFNFIVTDLSIVALAALLATMLALKVHRLRKEGLVAKEIALYLVRRPFYYLSIFFFFLVATSALLFLLYVLLSSNYYLLYRMSGN
ncbi:MAG: hypothetical protein JW807_02780 [Spirochaetes bacterium]|nr:hypothetical protein [Spirochaetota bacterium]